MPFKIIETFDKKGKKELSICPSGWESEGMLSWPMKKAAKKSKIEDSVPDTNWMQLNCIVKRKNIKNYSDAEQELNLMVNFTDTEPEEGTTCTRRRDLEGDFNHILTQMLDQPTPLPIADSINDTTVENYVIIENQPAITNSNSIIDTNAKAYEDILLNQKVLFDNQNSIIENQKKIMMALADITVKVEKKLTVPTPPTVTIFDDKLKKNPINTALQPIQTIRELELVEENLNDNDWRNSYKSKYAIFCSKGKGVNCAYQLIDVFFSREFLTQCSWTGSTKGEGTKICLKVFKNFLNLFFELIYACDPTYTVQANNEFFKSILKNAMKRKLAKFQRTSSSRNTPKRGKNNLQEIIKEIDNNNDPTQSNDKNINLEKKLITEDNERADAMDDNNMENINPNNLE